MLKGRRAWIQFALFLAAASSSSKSSAAFLIPCPPHKDYIFRRWRRRDGAGAAQCPATADKNERLAQRPSQSTGTCTTQLGAAAKRAGGGAGGGGFGSSSSSSSSAASKNNKKAGASTAAGKKSILKKLERTYGGTSPQEIAAATQRSIEQTLSKLPTHLQLGTKLYQQLRLWNARWAALSILEQANVPMSQVEGAQRAQEELERLQAQHGITDADLHNIFQQVTWDASADAKAARAVTGTMPTDILARIDKACTIVVEAVVGASNTENGKGRCLDVGCGFGTLVPNLLRIRSSDNQKLQPSQIYGIDLSPAMIRNANELYSDCQFEACDFLQYSGPAVNSSDDDGCFDAVLFCSALPDMPDPVVAMRNAMSLLRLNGKLVIVHAQGSGHVNRQVAANPVLVRRGLPDAEELQRILKDMPEGSFVMETEPAKASTAKDMEEGYLAVVQRLQ